MLEVFIDFLCALILALFGFYFIKIIIDSEKNINYKKIGILILNSLFISTFHYLKYDSPFLNFIVNIITYKVIFSINIVEATLVTGILFLFILFSETIGLLLQLILLPLYKLRNNIFIYFFNNIIVFLISIILMKIKIIPKYSKKIYNVLLKKDYHINVIFIILIIIAESGIIYNLFINYNIDYKAFINIIIIISLLAIGILFINNKDTYNKLSQEYELLLQNLQTFEEWIEREQFTRHEYKNQLAVLYAISSEKEVKCKIEEIINQNLNINNEVVNNLKDLPKGGIKGLLYYKTIIAEKAKIKVTVDVSIKQKGILNRLTKEKTNTLAKLIGIYYDNAIEASKESYKKNLLLEIYELKDRINIVISNTYKKTSIIKNNYQKGVSSKGKNRGNGLFFARKILENNKWIEEKQELIDNYYIETISIRKGTSKK